MTEDNRFDYLIIGAGAAGLASAIYGVRAGMKTIVLEGKGAGGQTGEASEIENYPGFEKIEGMKLAEKFKRHAEVYTQIHEGRSVVSIEHVRDMKGVHFLVKDSSGDGYYAGAILLATGAEHRKLGVKGEADFAGKGVSYCATCDGFFFRGRKVLMIGGGNTALMDAIYLKGIGVDVSIAHRRSEFRGDMVYREKVKELGIPVVWNSVVEEIKGERTLQSIVLKNVVTGEITEHEANGIFIAVGITPNNQLATALGCQLDGNGYVKVNRKQRTTVPYVYAAGDLVGGMQQIVVAAAEGAIAAMTAFEDITSPYWVVNERTGE